MTPRSSFYGSNRGGVVSAFVAVFSACVIFTCSVLSFSAHAHAEELLLDSTAGAVETPSNIANVFQEWNDGGISCDEVPDWQVSRMIMSVRRATRITSPFHFGAQIVHGGAYNLYGGASTTLAAETFVATTTSFSDYEFTWPVQPNLRRLCLANGAGTPIAIGIARVDGGGVGVTRWSPDSVSGNFNNTSGSDHAWDLALRLYGTHGMPRTPVLAALSQFREFGADAIAPGAGFIGNAVVLKADVADADSASVRIEVEMKPVGTAFDGTNLYATSTPTTTPPIATTTLAVSIDELIPPADQYAGDIHKAFHWRARAVDAEGNASKWQEFTPDSASFTANVVPLWTQVQSNYPVRSPKDEWSEKLYASGVDTSCARNVPGFRATIGTCGCAITSLVMLAHFYGATQGLDGSPLTPASLNTWLQNNRGYVGANFLSWPRALAYLGSYTSGGKIQTPFALELVTDASGRSTQKIYDHTLADTYLASQPILAFDNRIGHYFLLDSKLPAAAAYTLRDPYFYDTRTLHDASAPHVRDYGNSYTFATVVRHLDTPVIASAHTELYLASPAEILVTDPQGRRAGFDPATDAFYHEIPGASYDLEDPIADSETEFDPASVHQVKVLSLPSITDGSYSIDIIGTGEGSYTFTAEMTTDTGTTTERIFTASTTPGQTTEYVLTSQGGEQSVTLSVEELLVAIERTIRASSIKPGIKTALLAETKVMRAAYERNKPQAAKAIANAMTLEIRALTDKAIPPDTADALLRLLADLKTRL